MRSIDQKYQTALNLKEPTSVQTDPILNQTIPPNFEGSPKITARKNPEFLLHWPKHFFDNYYVFILWNSAEFSLLSEKGG